MADETTCRHRSNYMYTRNCLINAVMAGSSRDVLELLKSRTPRKLYVEENPLLDCAVTNFDTKIVEILLQHGAKPHIHTLLRAAQDGYKDIAINLILYGADPNKETVQDLTILQILSNSKEPRAEMCEILLKHGADVNLALKEKPPLWLAMMWRNYEIMTVLLQYGANPLKQFQSPCSRGVVLQYALTLPDQSKIKTVVKYAALQVNTSNNRRRNAFLRYFQQNFSNQNITIPYQFRHKRRKLKYKSYTIKTNYATNHDYLEFAKACLDEINVLKKRNIKNTGLNLFEFIICDRHDLWYIQRNPDIVHNIFANISMTFLCLYKDVILRKFDLEIIRDKILELPINKILFTESNGKKIYLALHCIQRIFKYLSKDDLISVYLALASLIAFL